MNEIDITQYNAIIHATMFGLLEVHAFEIELRSGDNPECLELVFRIEWNEGSIRRETVFVVEVPVPNYKGDLHFNLVMKGDDPWKAWVGVVVWDDQIQPQDDAQVLWSKEFKKGKKYFGG